MEVAVLQRPEQVAIVAHMHEYIAEAGSTALVLERVRGPGLFDYVSVCGSACASTR